MDFLHGFSKRKDAYNIESPKELDQKGVISDYTHKMREANAKLSMDRVFEGFPWSAEGGGQRRAVTPGWCQRLCPWRERQQIVWIRGYGYGYNCWQKQRSR